MTRRNHAGTGARTPANALWMQVDTGLHVGNDGGRFLGSVEADPSGGFLAYGAESQFLGRFAGLEEAKVAAMWPPVPAASVRHRHRRMGAERSGSDLLDLLRPLRRAASRSRIGRA